MYHGFPYRINIIYDHIVFGKNKVALEIGVGTGYNLIVLSGKFKKIYGFDISKCSIDLLSGNIKNENVFLDVVDVCSKIDRRYENYFDVIFSMDTLEHIKSPSMFFRNIKFLLKKGGMAFIGFPNETQTKHHGVTWFNTRDDLLKVVDPSLILSIMKIEKTKYFSFICNQLWAGPRKLLKMIIWNKAYSTNTKPQIFEETDAFSLNKNHTFLAHIFNIYPAILLKIANLGKMFKCEELSDNDIVDKYLQLKIQKK